VRDEAEEVRVMRMASFVNMLKYPIDESQRENFQRGRSPGLTGMRARDDDV
jgi:hypothetical protein